MSKALSLPPTHGIVDPQARAWAEQVAAMLAMRSGHTREQGERFVTMNEFSGLAAQSIVETLGGGSVGVPNVSGNRVPPTAAEIGRVIDNISDLIRQSVVFQLLEMPILQIDVEALAARFQEGINSESQVRQSATAATTLQINSAVSRIEGAEGGISTEANTRSSKDFALASAINNIWALVGGSSAVIQDGSLASATPSASTATRWLQVQAAVTDPNTGQVSATSIRQELNSYASTTDGKLQSIYSVRAQVSVGGQTLVGGFGLAATSGGGAGPTIDFGVRADKFFIAATSATPDAATQISQGSAIPFMVLTSNQTVNGVTYGPGVYIKKAVIGAATIGSAEIADAAITNAQIADAAITNAKIVNASIDNAKMSGPIFSDNWPSSAGSAGWAIFRDGSAFFRNVTVRGDVQATSVTANTITAANIVTDSLNTFWKSQYQTTLWFNVPDGMVAKCVRVYVKLGWNTTGGKDGNSYPNTGTVSVYGSSFGVNGSDQISVYNVGAGNHQIVVSSGVTPRAIEADVVMR